MFWAKSNQEDKLFWLKMKTGLFNVKTAYHVQEKDLYKEKKMVEDPLEKQSP